MEKAKLQKMKGEITLKNSKRIISILTVLAMIAVMFSAVTLTTAAESITYDGRVAPESYAWLENAQGERDDTLSLGTCNVDGQEAGKLIVDSEGAVVAGAIVFRFADNVKNLQLLAGYSTSSWLGLVTVEASADGTTFSPVSMTLGSQSGYYWGGASVYQQNWYTSDSDFTAADGIRYIKVKLPHGSPFAAPGLYFLEYNTCSDPLSTYAQAYATSAAVETSGELTYGGSYSADYYYFAGTTGSIVFAADSFAAITDFKASVLLHNPYKHSHFKVQVSSDGVNYSGVAVALKKDGNEFGGWDCSGYTAYGSFDAADEVRFVKFTLGNTITAAAGIRSFSCNSAMAELVYCNEFNMANGTSETGNVVSAGPAGGYLVTNGGSATTGSMIYYDADGISNFRVEYAQVFAPYGNITLSASVDGETWTNVTGSDSTLDETFAGDQNCHKHVFTGTLLPSAGYKYFRAYINDGGANPNFPVVFSIKYNKAAQLGAENPSEASSELKDSYDVTVAANHADVITPNYAGAVYQDSSAASSGQVNGYYGFYESGTSRAGSVDFYSGATITDFKIDGFGSNMSSGSSLKLYVSSDGTSWIPTDPAGKTLYDASHQPAWGNLGGYYFYGTLKESANIHYIRVVFSTEWLGFLPALRSVSYNYVRVDEPVSELGEYEITVGAASATATSAVAGAVYQDANTASSGQIAGYYAFYDAENHWQPGEAVYSSNEAITDYRISAFSGNVANFGILNFLASSDGVNYTPITPSKYTYEERGGWGDMAGNYFYGKLLASADIHYIKVKYVESGLWISFAPGVQKIKYNTTGTCGRVGHNYTAVVTAPTCTEEGYTTYTCTRCGDTYTDNYVSALDHTWDEGVTTPATCTEAGSILYTCTVCGETMTETIPAQGHSFTHYVSDHNATPTQDGTKTAVCDHGCGATDTVIDEGSRFGAVDQTIADFNNDGIINAIDLALFKQALLNSTALDADLNGDGATDLLDYIRLKKFIANSPDGVVVTTNAAVTEDPEKMD